MQRMMPVKNIIFDLGGVLIDIDFTKTKNAFIASGIHNFETYFQQSFSNPLFADLEKGLIAPVDFYEAFRKESGVHLPDQLIIDNWNALLGDFRKSGIQYVGELKKQYRVFLFSNTNIIHYEAFMQLFNDQFGSERFHDYFEKAYYSHEIRLRKPDVDSFEFILRENNLLAAESLFVDDTIKNIEGAKAAGLQTLWLENGMLIEQVMPGLLANAGNVQV
jgi:putative hydrolase of the HAD superfamily